MTSVYAAVTKVQQTTFVVVSMQDHVLNNPTMADEQQRALAVQFGHPLVVLMGEHNRKIRGRSDIVRYLASIDPGRLPWKRYTFS